MRETHTARTHKLWDKSWKLLRKICAETGESYVQGFHRLVCWEWEYQKTKEHYKKYSARLEEQERERTGE